MAIHCETCLAINADRPTEPNNITLTEYQKEVETELADTLIYLIRLADKLDINLITAAQRKIEANERKYPVEKARGSAEKYTVYE